MLYQCRPSWILTVHAASTAWYSAQALADDGQVRARRATVSNYRADLCSRAEAVQNGSLPISSGLSGVHLTIGTGIFDPIFLRNDSATGALAGLEVDLLDRMAAEGGFTYTNVLHDWSGVSSWTNALLETLPVFDVITYGYWTRTPERMLQGGYSPFAFLDFTYTLVGIRQGTEDPSFLKEMFQFLTPFTIGVWLIISVLVLVTGLLYWFLESRKNEDDLPEEWYWLNTVDSVFFAIWQLSGAGGFTPKTWPGKILLASWAWCTVLVVSAYTANLAQFLIFKALPEQEIDSLSQVIQQRKPICILPMGSIEDWFHHTYPGYSEVYKQSRTLAGMVEDLRSGNCDFLVLLRFEYELAKVDRQMNPNCDLDIIGQPLYAADGGWMVMNDYSEKCTALARDVLHLIFLKFSTDGTLDDVIEEAISGAGDRDRLGNCPDAGEAAQEEESEDPLEENQLGFEQMAGIIVSHFVYMLVAGAIYVFHKVHHHREVIVKTHSELLRKISGGSESAEGNQPGKQDEVEAGIPLPEKEASTASCLPPEVLENGYVLQEVKEKGAVLESEAGASHVKMQGSSLTSATGGAVHWNPDLETAPLSSALPVEYTANQSLKIESREPTGVTGLTCHSSNNVSREPTEGSGNRVLLVPPASVPFPSCDQAKANFMRSGPKLCPGRKGQAPGDTTDVPNPDPIAPRSGRALRAWLGDESIDDEVECL